MANKNLNKAKKAKNDEFYTPREAVESEVSRYRDSLTGKAIYCNCDDPIDSRFWKFFYRQFGFLKLKQLIATHYNMDGSPSYALIYKGGSDSCIDYTEGVTKIPLKDNGDFRSDECIEFLKQSDVVVTNPPFSLAREFIKQLTDYHKQFLIIGNKNWITYKEVFPLLMQNKMWLGANSVKYFYQPDGSVKKFGNVGWFTNLSVQRPTDQIVIFEPFDFAPHPAYDNFPAFEVSKVVDIPAQRVVTVDIDSENVQQWKDIYKDDIEVLSNKGTTTKVKVNRPIYGVPITFMDKYNPSSILPKHNLAKEFDIIGFGSGSFGRSIGVTGYKDKYKPFLGKTAPVAGNLYYVVNGKPKTPYKRILIRVKPGVVNF